MSGINNEYNEQEIAGSVTAGTSMFSDLFRRFGQPPMVVPEADEECRTYYQEILHIKAQLEQIDASNRGIDRIVVNADGTLTVYYSDGTTYTSPSLKGADGQDGQDGAPGQNGQDGADGQDGQDGAPGRDGVDGQDGVTPNITVTATVDNTPGTAGVTVTKSGTDANPIFAFNFVHVKGETGAQGQPGQNGVSPTAYVTQTGQNEVTFTVIDGNGTTTATLTGEAGAPGRDGQDGQDGEDGVSPVITVTDITGGHRVTISDADGTQSFDVMDGTDGQNGQNGTDGVSPTVTVTDITGGHQVSITDASSTQTFNVMNGADGRDGTNGTNGTDGVSPTIDVVTITGGHRVDITDAQGSESFTVMDGADGQDGAPGQNGTDGVTPDITMTATADATSSANPTVTVTKGGTTANPTFALAFSGLKGEQGIQGIQGVQGVQGETGATGPQGPAGPGVPTGGTAGQVLSKIDGTDYNTEWITPSGGGGMELILSAFHPNTSGMSSLIPLVEVGDIIYIEGAGVEMLKSGPNSYTNRIVIDAEATVLSNIVTRTTNTTYSASISGYLMLGLYVVTAKSSTSITITSLNSTAPVDKTIGIIEYNGSTVTYTELMTVDTTSNGIYKVSIGQRGSVTGNMRFYNYSKKVYKLKKS